MIPRILLTVLLLTTASCGHVPQRKVIEHVEPSRASLQFRDDRGNPDVLVLLALSGGGSRAAYFSSAVMFRLQTVFPEINLLKEVDAISSVSGGSLPAAYYCLSRDQADPSSTNGVRQIWKETDVKTAMQKNFIRKWIIQWFMPQNFVRYWFTNYTRTDTMAGIFEHDLFGSSQLGSKLTFRDLNPERPYLILNSTDATHVETEDEDTFRLFTFTEQDFSEKLGSNINDHSVGHGVMASAAFPGAFNYVTLPNQTADSQFVHLFDGGAFDNLGLSAVDAVAGFNWDRYKKLVVIVVDAYVSSQGVPADKRDPRSFFSHIIDTNFLDTYDSLLKANRQNMLNWFKQEVLADKYKQKDPTLCHLTFKAIPNATLRAGVNAIPTDFAISSEAARNLDRAAEMLVSTDTKCFQDIKASLLAVPRSP